jgi:hypothetical protein
MSVIEILHGMSQSHLHCIMNSLLPFQSKIAEVEVFWFEDGVWQCCIISVLALCLNSPSRYLDMNLWFPRALSQSLSVVYPQDIPKADFRLSSCAAYGAL